jgi:hypothetical protein
MKHKLYTTLFAFMLMAAINQLKAQKNNEYVQLQSDARLDSLVNQHIEANKAANGIQGFRVQVFFGSERKIAQDAKAKMLQLMPEEEIYLIYQQPYFKVRVGDYRTRLEAEAVYRKLMHEFDKVFIIPDKINLPKL